MNSSGSYASLWRLKTTAEMAEMLLTDVHAPNYLRTNVDVQQFEEFYQTYGVEPATACTWPRRTG